MVGKQIEGHSRQICRGLASICQPKSSALSICRCHLCRPGPALALAAALATCHTPRGKMRAEANVSHRDCRVDTALLLPVQFEGVGTVSVCSLLRHVLWQVDDHNRVKWAFLPGQSRLTSALVHKPLKDWQPIPRSECALTQDSRAHQQHTLTQMPQPMHNSSEIQAILELGATSMHCLPALQQFGQLVQFANSSQSACRIGCCGCCAYQS